MKILFVQLPLSDHSFSYVNGNIDYASASLSGFICNNYPEIFCETLPAVLSNFCSDELILKYINNTKPDVVSFTSYLWNIERNLSLAERLKEKMPDTAIIFGGPEIAEGSFSLRDHRPYVNYFVTGEGEWFFKSFLESGSILPSVINGNRVFIQPADELIEVSSICEPLTSRRLNSNNDASVFIELTRGCPYRCSYCYYSRNYKKVREISFDCLVASIKSTMNFKEIYILSPTFDRSSDFTEKLELLKKLNHNVKLHTEIRTDRIDKKTAKLMYDAGFRSLEVGLQSMNKRALGMINRESNTGKELSGMRNLSDAGIELQIGIIPGLPGDSPDNFIHTVDTLVSNNLGEYIELYPLMILPGTQIREMAIEHGAEFQDKPPYYFQSGWDFTSDDIRYISDYVEEKTGLSRSIFFLPDFTEPENSLFTKGIKFNGNLPGAWDLEKFSSLTERYVVDLHVICSHQQSLYSGIEKLFSSLARIGQRLINLIIYSDILINEDTLKQLMCKYETDSFHRRLNVFHSVAEASRFRFFQVSENINEFSRMDNIYSIITPIYMITEKSLNFTKILHNESAVLVQSGMYESISSFLKKVYAADPQFAAFQCEDEMQQFYNDIGEEYVKLPYNFGLVNA
ncbi:MAG TPA: B12-binding domain-containing radical SAM protein [Spirochaetota bacterium]|nr:B12-binding domain-containing radical SAM protein [Spirochaetota bacterium]